MRNLVPKLTAMAAAAGAARDSSPATYGFSVVRVAKR
jgi:hypothetical protein